MSTAECNGHRLRAVVEEAGTHRLGVDTLPQFVTRGLLLDIAAVHGFVAASIHKAPAPTVNWPTRGWPIDRLDSVWPTPGPVPARPARGWRGEPVLRRR